jgi:hypothetical protein
MEAYKTVFMIGKRKNSVIVERVPKNRGMGSPQELAEIKILDDDNYLGDVVFLNEVSPEELIEISEWVKMVNVQLREKNDNWFLDIPGV